MISLEETISIDEMTYYNKKKIVPIRASYIIEGNDVYLEKSNNTKERIGTLQYWVRIKEFTPTKEAKLKNSLSHSGCCISCGLCNFHKNKTALLNLVVTNRCNLRCWYCFFYSEKFGSIFEPSLQDIENILRAANRFNGYTPPVQITGGEPTLRKDLPEIIKIIKKYKSPHIQLNTNSIIHGINFYENDKKTVEELRKLKELGLNTLYISFDGLTPETNFKNYYELPYSFKAYRESGISSIVLVPTLHKKNLKEAVNIVKFGLKNLDVVRGINFQPISIVGMVPKEEREDLRVTQSDIVDELYEIGLRYEDFYPISSVQDLADLIGIGKEHVTFYNSEKCGLATYLFFDSEAKKAYPITKYIDVDGFLYNLKKIRNLSGKTYLTFKLFPYFLKNISIKKGFSEYLLNYVIEEELPNGVNLKNLIRNIVEKGNYKSLGEFHKNSLFIGIMHFMDPFNYDLKRVQRCSIHYGMPDGRIVPFCTYNVFPELYRDPIMKVYARFDENLAKEEKDEVKRVVEFRKNVDKNEVKSFYQLDF